MKYVLVTSKSFASVSDEPLQILQRAGCQPVYYNQIFDETEFAEKLSECAGLIIGSHRLTEAAVRGAKNLKVISKHGTGMDNIDLELAKQRGIKVTNVPSVNANAVADLAFGLMLNAARKISLGARRVRDGDWRYAMGVNVCGKALSLIGFGEIAQNVARRARGFSMEVYAYDPYMGCLPNEFSEFVKLASLQEALHNGDFLSIHVPLNEKTRNLITAKEIKEMKPGAILINTARGGIINENDLESALREGTLAGAGLDVLEQEPPSKDHPLLAMDQVIVTPHMGMYSFEAINQISVIAAQNVVAYING